MSVAKNLLYIMSLFEFPEKLRMDNRAENVSKVMHKLSKFLGYKEIFTIPNSCRSNGQYEKNIGTILQSICKICRAYSLVYNDWDRIINIVQFAIHQKINPKTLTSPYNLIFQHNQCGGCLIQKFAIKMN